MKFINSKDYNKKYYLLNKDRERERVKKYRENNPEKVKLSRKLSYEKVGKKWRLNNLDSVRKSSREWARKDRLKNPKKYIYCSSEKSKLYQKRYRTKHRKEITAKNVIYQKVKIENDVNYRLRWLLRSRINIAIKRQLGSKCFKTIELLGCSIQQAREHIEKQFKDGMTWENHGTWEIDHIIPVSSFNLTNPEEQKKAFHYTNLQPLNWKENRLKSNKIVI